MSVDPREICWVDGRLVPRSEPVVRADDSAFAEGRGCYTSVRIQNGRPRFADRHVRRLQRGALALRLGAVEAADVERALAELAATFADGEGVVRLQASCGADGRLQLVGVPRRLDEERREWSAITAPFAHAGAVLPGGHKLTNRLAMALAAASARDAGADEALLFDVHDRLVEGARSNVVAVGSDGVAAAPEEALGAVAGIALQVALERVPELVRRSIPRAELGGAREIVALNSVRGARPITLLDGRAVGDGVPGPWAARLEAALAKD